MQNFIFRAVCAMFLASFAFISCKKEVITDPITPQPKTISMGALANRDGEFGTIDDECFDILLPLTLVLSNGSTYIVDEQADLDYFENDDNAPEVDSVVFPITLREKATGNLIEMTNEGDFEAAWEDCAFDDIAADIDSEPLLTIMLVSMIIEPDALEEEYEFQFPMSFKNTDTNASQSVATVQEMIDYLTANQPVDENEEDWKIKFEYPFSVVKTGTQEVTLVTNKSDLVALVQLLYN
jgi:hypothetical protein